jgi:pimeloyl-ACP methyl ester carboxylesterase
VATPAARFADIDGHRIRYTLTGDSGLPLVTFANGLTQNADLWTAYAARLADSSYRVLAYDMLGQGQSSKPVLGTELAEHADLLVGLLTHLQVGARTWRASASAAWSRSTSRSGTASGSRASP